MCEPFCATQVFRHYRDDKDSCIWEIGVVELLGIRSRVWSCEWVVDMNWRLDDDKIRGKYIKELREQGFRVIVSVDIKLTKNYDAHRDEQNCNDSVKFSRNGGGYVCNL